MIDKQETINCKVTTKLDHKLKREDISFPHKCMYDTEALSRIMSEIGFECHAAKPFESNIPNIKIIELPDRTEQAVIIEAQKV